MVRAFSYIACLIVSFGLTSWSAPTAAYPALSANVASLLCRSRAAAGAGSDRYALTRYDNAATAIQQNCLSCHAQGGLAPNAGADLVLKSNTKAGYVAANHASFKALVAARSPQYVLSKAQGSAHGGGAILSAFSDDYQRLSDYVNALDSQASCSASANLKGNASISDAVWRGVSFNDDTETYRRAAIVIGRTVPSEEQLEAVRSGRVALHDAIQQLMQGPGFHEFLITGANDQLLTDAFMNGLFPVSVDSNRYPLVGSAYHALYEGVGRSEERYNNNARWELWIARNYGHARAPAELIAYIVENDRSYKEILTADFTMMTPLIADIFDADIKWSQDVVYDGEYTDFHMQFKPGIDSGGVAEYPSGEQTCVPVPPQECYYTNFKRHRKQHAGVLSTIAFMQRYPTTETNRNRARARWTAKFFLGLDIEASASRTTDPVALADTNNPTMNNPACTVCHQGMDPMAGAFQNYDEQGIFRPNITDALPWLYKSEEGSIYQEGDTWFRDMRAPGFKGVTAPDNDSSLPWLAAQIANDPRFAVGTVEFWWPAVMGTPVLSAPEDPNLPNYDDQLLAFSLQRDEISRLAKGFAKSRFNLKSLLSSMATSRWFNAEAVPDGHAYAETLIAAGVAKKRLLTPEELDAKTAALIGVRMGTAEGGYINNGILPIPGSYLFNNRIALGGIDSYQVQKRARDMTAVSATVIDKHACAASRTFTEAERETKAEHRRLLNQIDFSEPPKDTTELRQTVVEAYENLHFKTYDTQHPAVTLIVDLLLEAFDGNPAASWCGINTTDDLAALKAAASKQGHWLDANRQRSDEEFRNTTAWNFVFDYMFSHFDYVHN